MSPDPHPKAPYCSACGAELDVGAKRCWLCDELLDRPDKIVRRERPTSELRYGWMFVVDVLLVVTVVALVLSGVAIERQGYGVALAIVAVPALVRTVVFDTRRWLAGKRDRWYIAVVHFVGAFFVYMTVACTVFLAFAVAFVIKCFEMLKPPGGH